MFESFLRSSSVNSLCGLSTDKMSSVLSTFSFRRLLLEFVFPMSISIKSVLLSPALAAGIINNKNIRSIIIKYLFFNIISFPLLLCSHY